MLGTPRVDGWGSAATGALTLFRRKFFPALADGWSVRQWRLAERLGSSLRDACGYEKILTNHQE
eukprot:9377372-Pyramimonas_sp.AAC.1